MTHSAGDLMVVLANLVPGRHHGGSCACQGTASRVVALESLFDRRPCTILRVWLTEVPELHSGRCGNISSALVHTVLGMALQ
jgi:hypothetical protein